MGMSLKPAFMEHGLNGPGVEGRKTNFHTDPGCLMTYKR